MFYLVQRIEAKPSSLDRISFGQKTHSLKFDDVFTCAYMGASEYEFGIVPYSFRMLQDTGVRVEVRDITRENVTHRVYFVVGLPNRLTALNSWVNLGSEYDTSFEEILGEFRKWFSQPEPRCSEWSEFPEAFESFDQSTEIEPYGSVAWWSLKEHVIWTLRLEIAEQLVNAINLEVHE
jgi:hypothetical protein